MLIITHIPHPHSLCSAVTTARLIMQRAYLLQRHAPLRRDNDVLRRLRLVVNLDGARVRRKSASGAATLQ